MSLRINETPCKLTFYSCTECTEEDLKLFMSFARKQYQKALGPIGPGGGDDDDDQCVKTQELVDFKVTVVQGSSKTPIMVPRPSTNCPCRDTPVFQYQLKSEYQPDCVSYEEFKKAKQLLQK